MKHLFRFNTSPRWGVLVCERILLRAWLCFLVAAVFTTDSMAQIPREVLWTHPGSPSTGVASILRLSPDNSLLVYVTQGRELVLESSVDGAFVSAMDLQSYGLITALAVSDSAHIVLLGTATGQVVKIENLADAPVIRQGQLSNTAVTSMLVSANSLQFAAGFADGRVAFGSCANFPSAAGLDVSTNSIEQLSFFPGKSWLIVDGHGPLFVVDLEKQTVVISAQIPLGACRALACDQQRGVISTCVGEQLFEYDVEAARLTMLPWTLSSSEPLVEIRPNQGLVFSSGTSQTVYSYDSGRVLKTWNLLSGSVSLAVGMSGWPIVVPTISGDILAMDSLFGSIRDLHGHQYGVGAVQIADSVGACYTVGVDDRRLRGWSLQSGALISDIPISEAGLSCMAVSPNGSLVAIGGSDSLIELYDTKNGNLVRRLHGHRSTKGQTGILSLDWSRDGSFLVSGGADSTVRLWDVRNDFSGHIVCTVPAKASVVRVAPRGDVIGVGFGPFARVVGIDGSIVLNGQALTQINRISFSSGGDQVLFSGGGGYLYDVTTGAALWGQGTSNFSPLELYPNQPWILAFRDGTEQMPALFSSLSYDSIVHRYQKVYGRATDLAISEDGSVLVMGDDSGRVTAIAPSAWIERRVSEGSTSNEPATLVAYPNPASREIHVSYYCSSQNSTAIALCDMLGQEVWSDHPQSVIGSSHASIDVSKLPAGTYTLAVGTPKEMRRALVCVYH